MVFAIYNAPKMIIDYGVLSFTLWMVLLSINRVLVIVNKMEWVILR